jgi:hypothetical protein
MTVENNAAPAPAAPASVKPAAQYQADVTKQLTEKFSGQKAETPAPAAKAPDIKPEQAPSPTIAASLQKIAEQNKALREREDRVKAYEDIARVVDPLKLSRAAAARDPLAVLEAVGMRYEDVVDRVLQDQPKGAQPAKVEEKPEAEGIVAELQKKLAVLEKERNDEKVGKARASLIQQGLTFASPEKFPLVARLGEEAVGEAIDVLLEFAEKTGGKFPADTIQANMELALAHVEERHKKIAERYGLTSGSVTPSVKSAEAPVQPRGEADGQTTLTSSSLAAPASGGAAPKTDADYQAAAAAQLRKLMGG